jgi:hypothetical protein
MIEAVSSGELREESRSEEMLEEAALGSYNWFHTALNY